MKDRPKRGMDSSGFWFAAYTLVFAVVAALAYMPFWSRGTSMVWCQDGMNQHVIALTYIGRWGREILKNLFVDHVWKIPVWDFSIGMGADVLTTMHYYGLGDPLAMLSVLVPEEHIAVFYSALVVLRLYLAGWFFCCFCRYMNKAAAASIAGALTYVFCAYGLYAGVRHPFFLTPMVYLPLLILGSEKMLRRENPAVFIVSLCLTTLSNFYFAYMQCVMVILYVCVRYFTIEGISPKAEIGGFFLRFLVSGLTGLAMAGVLFIPVVACVLESSRSAAGNAVPLLYPADFYKAYFTGFIAYGEAEGTWTMLGFSPLSLLGMMLAVLHPKKNRTLIMLSGVMLVMQMIPAFGYALNGFAYVSNRWSWAFSFAMAYAVAALWPEFTDAGRKEKVFLLVCSAAYLLLSDCIGGREASIVHRQWMVMAACVLVVLAGGRFRYIRTVKGGALCALTIVSLLLNADYLFNEKSYADDFVPNQDVHSMITQTKSGHAKPVLPERFDGRYVLKNGYQNESILSGTYGTSAYWSLQGNRIAQFRLDMGLTNDQSYRWFGFDGRAYLDALSGVRFYLGGSMEQPVHGLRLLQENDQFALYEKESVLPLGYTYDTVITRQAYEQMPFEQRQEALMQGVLLEGNAQHAYAQNEYALSGRMVAYQTYSPEENCRIEDGVIRVEEDGASLVFTFDPQPACELGLVIQGLRASGGNTEKYRLYFSTAEYTQHFLYRTPYEQFYSGMQNYLVNTGYQDGNCTEITITFARKGVYAFDRLGVYCQPLDALEELVRARSACALENVQLEVNGFSGSVQAEEQSILCLSVPYSTGWTARVDGKETPLLCANVWSLALELPLGEHEIEFRYVTPGLKAGALISALGIGVFILIQYSFRRKKGVAR